MQIRKIFYVASLFIISFQAISFGQLRDSLSLSFEAVDSEEKRVDALNKLSKTLLQNNKPDEAEQRAFQAEEMSIEFRYPAGQAEAIDNQGHVFIARFDHTNAMRCFVKALKLRNQQQDKSPIAISKYNIGRVFFLQGELDKAENNLLEALNILANSDNQEGAAATNKLLGEIYVQKQIFGKAKNYYGKALNLKLALKQTEDAAQIANQIGKLSTELGDYEGALAHFQLSLDLHQATEDVPQIANDYNNIALTFITQGNFEEALDANDTASRIREELDQSLELAESQTNFGIIYAGLQEPENADKFLEDAVRILNEIELQPGVETIFKQIAVTYNSLGHYDKAYLNHIAYSEAKEGLYNQEKTRALLELTTQYESEFEAEKQQGQIELLELDKSNNRKIRSFLFVVIGLILLLLLNLFLNYKRKQRDNKTLIANNQEIEEQKTLIKESHHQLEAQNAKLEILNKKILKEMAEREAIEQSSFARDRFLVAMSNEMRTPINIIIGLSHLLLEEEPRKDQVDHLRTLQFSANNLVVFINDILDYSKIETGKLALKNKRFQLLNSFKEIEKRFSPIFTEKEVKANFSFDNKLPQYTIGDPTRLNQILTTLLNTSVENTTKGNVNVRMQMEELHKDEMVLKIEIKDDGKGLEAEKIEEIFKPFDTDTWENFDGYDTSDLALAITNRLVELQNGNLEVISNEEEGTSYTCLLPYRIINGEVQQTESSETTPTYKNLAGNKILIVEDNPINQLVVAKLLRKMGMEVFTANNGLEALDVFKQEYFDLILMDIQMPEMDGYRTTAEIREFTDPIKREIPIIALTASAYLTEKEKAKLFGMNDHLGKPFSPEDLLLKLNSFFAKKQRKV
ncbi:MAG: tetratricopeptide repeat protein [Bacteroidetes bacterium]|nr:tetratricopeptide repeat protein [Bacteroidota bacterium]